MKTFDPRIKSVLVVSVMLTLLGAIVMLSVRNDKHNEAPIAGATSVPQITARRKAVMTRAGAAWLQRGVVFQGAKPARLVFSPDGRLCARATDDLTLWDARTGKMIGTLLPAVRGRRGFPFLRPYFISNQALVVINGHNVLRMNLKGKISRRYFGRGTYRPISSPAQIPNQQQILLWMDDPFRPYSNPDKNRIQMRRLDLKSGKLLTWDGDFGRGNISKMEIRGSFIALLFPYTRVSLLNAYAATQWSRPVPMDADEDERTEFFKSIALSPKGDFLFILTSEPKLTRLDTRTKRETKVLSSSDFSSVTISPDGRFLLLSNEQGRLAIYSLKTQRLIKEVIFPFPARNLVFSPDGKHVSVQGMAIVPFVL